MILEIQFWYVNYTLVARICKNIANHKAKAVYCISCNKHRASKKRPPLISAALLCIHIEISTSL